MQPQAGCCFLAGDAFLCVASSACLAAAACTRWCGGPCCLCPTCAKIWGYPENHIVDGLCHGIDHHIFSCCSFFHSFFLFSPFLSAGTRHLLGNVGLEPAGRGSSWKLLGRLSLWRALGKFCTDNEQSAASCFQKAKKSGWDSRALRHRFPHNPNFMEG